MKRFGLFLKIYLSFLLTTIVIVSTFVYLDHLTGSGPMIRHWRQTVGKTISFYGTEAVRIYDQEGAPSLKDFFSRLEKATGVQAFLFDKAGHEISGRPMSGKTKEMIASVMSDRYDGGELHDEHFSAMAEKIAGLKGTYSFVSIRPHPFPMGPVPPPMQGPHFGPSSDQRPGFGLHPMPPPGPPPGFSPLHFYVRLFIALVLSGLACFLLARYLTRPIFTLGHAARQLAGGNLSIRVGHALSSHKDELAGLAADFDLMAERIETLLVSQQNLLRDVSHELRSPLARLNVSLELCRKRFGMEGEDLLSRMENEVRKLDRLIGQILTLNRIEMDPVNIAKAPVDLEELLEEVIADANYEAGQNRTTLLESRPCSVHGNRELLRRAFENTVRNALSHTPPDSTVEITLRCAGTEEAKGTASIVIRDHGEGVPESELNLIFRPFYRVAESGALSAGTGLGLAIAEAALRRHGGSIVARNAPDGGLIMEMTLPCT